MFRPGAIVLVLLLAGCHTQAPEEVIDRGSYQADVSRTALGMDQRIRFVVLHYTAENDADSLRILTQEAVSAHYLIPSRPDVKRGKPVALQLVPESRRAWHAGASFWQGRTNLNDTSLGIEIVNAGPRDDDWAPFSAAQIDLVIALLKDVTARYNIPPQNVLGHMDVAPGRKKDPGPAFPWRRLAQAGVGAWPDEAAVQRYQAGRPDDMPVNIARLHQKLARYGYNIGVNGVNDDASRAAIAAFQMHFRPADYRGNADAGSEAIIDALLEKYGGRE